MTVKEGQLINFYTLFGRVLFVVNDGVHVFTFGIVNGWIALAIDGQSSANSGKHFTSNPLLEFIPLSTKSII